jgi:hypothetical protein
MNQRTPCASTGEFFNTIRHKRSFHNHSLREFAARSFSQKNHRQTCKKNDSLLTPASKPVSIDERFTSRRRGRPARSNTMPADPGAEIWVRVQIHRIKERIGTGKAPLVARACGALIASGGIQSVGGHPQEIS